MKNLFYSAADKIGQKPDSILYRLPTGHPIYSMPFGRSEYLLYPPVKVGVIYAPGRESICRANVGVVNKHNSFCLLLSSASGR